jgi:hypothetical protein
VAHIREGSEIPVDLKEIVLGEELRRLDPPAQPSSLK